MDKVNAFLVEISPFLKKKRHPCHYFPPPTPKAIGPRACNCSAEWPVRVPDAFP